MNLQKVCKKLEVSPNNVTTEKYRVSQAIAELRVDEYY